MQCSNYRGVKLISHSMKILERIVEKRLRSLITISDEQLGFMPGRSTVDAIFALRTTQAKYRDHQTPLYATFLDLEKAFDRVRRSDVWDCLRKKSIPEAYVGLLKQMYSGSRTAVRTAVGTTDYFSVNTGLHQGSALSPFLFIVLMDQATESIRRETPYSMMFADDVVLLSESRVEAQVQLDFWRQSLSEYGLTISGSKTELLQGLEGDADPAIKLGGDYGAGGRRLQVLRVHSPARCGL